MNRILILLCISILINTSVKSQNIDLKDSLITEIQTNKRNLDLIDTKYRKAPILSAILPGLGQIYNKQYWKLPVIYGGYLIIFHYVKFNNNMYKEFRSALIAEIDGDDMTINPFPNFTESSLERNMEYWRRNRDLLLIFTGVYYLLNIVDAHVFSHLNHFDIGNNISLNLSPKIDRIFNYNNFYGFGLKLVF